MDREKILELKAMSFDKYKDVDLDHLVMYSIGHLEKIGAGLFLENVVIASFKLFPKKFSLIGFPDYPDANRVVKCLWRFTTKTRPWLSGKVKQGYVITERGRMCIQEAENILKGQSQKVKRAASQTRREEKLLKEVMSSPAYLKYVEKENDSISEGDLCYLLQGTLDSDRQMLKENLFQLRDYASELKRQDLLEFFNWLERHFRTFLGIVEK